MTSPEPREIYTFRGSKASTNFIARRIASTHAFFFLPHLQASMRLLDAGCGPGSITVGLAEAVAPGEVVGIDNDEAHLQRTRETTAAQGLANVRFEQGDIYALPFPDQSFDAVFAHAVLEHLREPIRALKEFYRVLKTGGVVGIRNGDIDGWLITPLEPAHSKLWRARSASSADTSWDEGGSRYCSGRLRLEPRIFVFTKEGHRTETPIGRPR